MAHTCLLPSVPISSGPVTFFCDEALMQAVVRAHASNSSTGEAVGVERAIVIPLT